LIYKGANIMNKAKIMLSAIAVFAIVGGALAFNAKKFGFGNVYGSYTTLSSGQIVTRCALINTLKFTPGLPGIFVGAYTNTGDNDICIGHTTTFITTTMPGN
jgi:hypothetical protein